MTDMYSKPLKIGLRKNGELSKRSVRLKKAAKDFEGILIGQFFKLMNSTITRNGIMDRSFQRGIYEEMLQGEFAKIFTERGGFGLNRDVIKTVEVSKAIESDSARRGGEKANSYRRLDNHKKFMFPPKGKKFRLNDRVIKSLKTDDSIKEKIDMQNRESED